MSYYTITDIHFHTNDSFDAYENNNHSSLDIGMLSNQKSGYSNQNVELICKTDHNVLNYKNYLALKSQFKSMGINMLPGIEMNLTDKVHWLFIFSDIELSKADANGKTVGDRLDDGITSIYSYSIRNGTMKERKTAQNSTLPVEKVIRMINELELSFLAIPHFNKSSGWYNQIKLNNKNLTLINYLISDNIIVGFESKNQEEELIRSIEQTQTHLERYLKDFEEGRLSDITQISNRENHLNMLNELKEMFDNNDTSLIYGSDYHGDGIYQIDNLFYMKSENSFEGLKFALIDPYSRIFSEDRFKKFNKESNYILESIKFKGVDEKVLLGDALNSVIGPRGSGKSYLLKMLTGNTSEYNYSLISKKLKIEKIYLSEGSAFDYLQPQHYDLISQKNSLSKDNNKNIYNLLSEAPYNYKKFEQELEMNFEKNQEKSNNISLYFSNINKLIKSYILVGNSRLNLPDFSSIDRYNEFYEKESDEVRLSNQFEELEMKLDRYLRTYHSNSALLIKNKETAKEFKEQLLKIRDFTETKKLNLIDIVDKLVDIVDGFDSNARVPIQEKINIKEKRVDDVLKRVISINKNLKDSKSNTQLVLNDHISDLKSYIGKSKRYLEDAMNLEETVLATSNKLLDTTVYEFKQDEFIYKIKLEKNFDKSKISVQQFNTIFSKYKNLDNSKANKLIDLFESNDFGKKFLKMYADKDNRFTDASLNVPVINNEIFLSLNSEKYEKWESLSPGQRSDILLNIILDTSSKRILIIDQPEDDLDNEMIYKTIVKKLRKLKLSKQIIVVSHNANVVITGDSDTITVCQNYENNFEMATDIMESKNKLKYTSINTSKLEDTVLNIASLILDGGNEALKRRVKKIGYKKLFFGEE